MNTSPISQAAAYAWLEAYEAQLEQCDQLDDIATTAFAHIVTAGSSLDERLVQLAVQDMADDTLGACRPPVGMTAEEVRDCAGFTPFVLHQAELLRGALKAFFEEHAAAEEDDAVQSAAASVSSLAEVERLCVAGWVAAVDRPDLQPGAAELLSRARAARAAAEEQLLEACRARQAVTA